MSSENTIDQEIVDHVMNPKNYGELPGADGVGVGVDKATEEYVLFYLNLDDGIITDATFATSGSQDVVALGSMLTEMIKGDSVENVLETVSGLEAEVAELYTQHKPKVDMTKEEGKQVEAISTKEQDGASMVLTAFRAAMRHIERKKEGIEEDKFFMNIKKRCPYSSSDCELA